MLTLSLSMMLGNTLNQGGGDGMPLPAGYAAVVDERFSTIDFDVWKPRIIAQTDPESSYADNEYAFYIDPQDADWNGYTPFSLGGGVTITARRVSEMNPAPAGGAVPTDPKTGLAFTWASGILQAPSYAFRSGVVDTVVSGIISDPAAWVGAYFRPVGGIYPEIDNPEIVFFDEPLGQTVLNLITAFGVQFPNVLEGPDFTARSHWFRTIITDTAIEFYHAGALIYTIDITAKPEAQAAFYPILSLAVGSDAALWVEPPDGSTISPLTVKYERVRIARKAGPDSLAMSETTILDANTNGTLGTLSHTVYGASTDGAYSLDDDDSGRFSIVGSTVSIATSAAGSYSFVARVTDNEGNIWRRKFTVTVVADSLGTNLFTFPSDFTNAAWSKFDATAVAGTPQSIQETATSAQHSLSRAITKAASLLPYTLAVDVSYDVANVIEWIKLELANNFSAPAVVSYNARTGEVGALHFDDGGAGTVELLTYDNQNLGGGVRRLLMRCNVPAAVTTNFRFNLKTLAADNEFGNRLGAISNRIKVNKVQLVQV